MDSSKEDINTLIKNLCITIKTELDSIGGSMKSKETIPEILQFSNSKALEYVSLNIEKAIAEKRKAKSDPHYKEFIKSEIYQKEMQKLEHEIRNHIKIEQQMKLYSDALEEKLQSLENAKEEISRNSNSKLESLKEENKSLKSRFASKTKELESAKKNKDSNNKEISKAKESIKCAEIDKKLARLEQEYAKICKNISEFEKEYIQHKKDNEELKILVKEFMNVYNEGNKDIQALIKVRYENKCVEAENLKRKIKNLEGTRSKNNNRSISPGINKITNTQSVKYIRKISSTGRIRPQKQEKVLHKNSREKLIEKKRLPLSFTSRK